MHQNIYIPTLLFYLKKYLHRYVSFNLDFRWYLDVTSIAIHITKEGKLQHILHFLCLEIMVLTGSSDCAVTAILKKKHPLDKIILNILVILHKTWFLWFFHNPNSVISSTQIHNGGVHTYQSNGLFDSVMQKTWNRILASGIISFSFYRKKGEKRILWKQLLRIDQNLTMKAKEWGENK